MWVEDTRNNSGQLAIPVGRADGGPLPKFADRLLPSGAWLRGCCCVRCERGDRGPVRRTEPTVFGNDYYVLSRAVIEWIFARRTRPKLRRMLSVAAVEVRDGRPCMPVWPRDGRPCMLVWPRDGRGRAPVVLRCLSVCWFDLAAPPVICRCVFVM